MKKLVCRNAYGLSNLMRMLSRESPCKNKGVFYTENNMGNGVGCIETSVFVNEKGNELYYLTLYGEAKEKEGEFMKFSKRGKFSFLLRGKDYTKFTACETTFKKVVYKKNKEGKVHLRFYRKCNLFKPYVTI